MEKKNFVEYEKDLACPRNDGNYYNYLVDVVGLSNVFAKECTATRLLPKLSFLENSIYGVVRIDNVSGGKKIP